MSYRQAKRLKAKVMAEGLLGLCHGNRGRPPRNRLEEPLRARVLELSRETVEHSKHFHDTVAACYRRDTAVIEVRLVDYRKGDIAQEFVGA